MHPLLLVIAAHPDDETIGAASLLLRHRAAVVHVTDGAPRDPALRAGGAANGREAYARLRRDEALAALAEARLRAADVIGLGVVDQEASEAIAAVARDLAALVRSLRPRLVVTHAFEGGHPDHDATALAVRSARALLARTPGGAPALAEMTSYHRGPDGAVVTGAFLPSRAAERVRWLEPAARETKRRMLAAYASQRETLAPFRADVERFRSAPPLDPARRPHPGALHYEAMGWATFDALAARARRAAASLGLEEAAWR
ncbi:LmbE family protein [Anaeromyxobacter sp. K]|uniref:PIG-L deacetylase family protein n=1 Tax=Anaeromyxobacter sp. (strain K) TaxID=447217 RepID=UPI00015F9A1B|nr:PIG-L family deacetylase [Anaeromyxobacter sp. K]ACG72310.1 LmbE family protein [Anaeromyxobacter sp. K]